jgi:hypothetical protein
VYCPLVRPTSKPFALIPVLALRDLFVSQPKITGKVPGIVYRTKATADTGIE